MDHYVSKLRALDEQLLLIKQQYPDIVYSSEISIEICRQVLEEIKEHILQNGFPTQDHEIDFFRNIKPQFLSRHIHHVKIFAIENNRPQAHSKIVKQYLIDQQNRITNFVNTNRDFYRYYRTGKTHSDHKYFTRGNYNLQLLLGDNFFYNSDASFTTGYDFILARFFAGNSVRKYLEYEIEHIKRYTSISAPLASRVNLSWTSSKIHLIELIYALQSSKFINNGNTNITDLASAFEMIFNIDLKDYHRKFIEIKDRKANHAKCIDILKTSLINRINEEG